MIRWFLFWFIFIPCMARATYDSATMGSPLDGGPGEVSTDTLTGDIAAIVSSITGEDDD